MKENFNALERDLEELDAAVTDILKDRPGLAVLASHPVYQYLGRRYWLDITSVFWEPDADPGEGQWKLLEDLISGEEFSKMLWEGQPLPETTLRLEEMGIQVIVYDPGANVPDSGDWLSVMQSNVENLKKNIR
jgi:zinc transport system substrate-binding protein